MSAQGNGPRTFDAIVMAGDREAYRSVCGQNKALLEVEAKPILVHILEALDRCPYVARIFVVGPRERIAAVLGPRSDRDKELVLVEQSRTLVENAWKGFLATIPATDADGRAFTEEELRERYGEKVVLIVGSDIPLVTHHELEEFIEGSDLERYDYLMGMSTEETLSAFYPGAGRPGVRFAYFHFRETLERQNNLHMIRVFRIINRKYTELMYRFRYQKRWKNILQLLWVLLRMPEIRLGTVLRFCLLHLCRVLARLPGVPLQRLLHRFVPKRKVEEDVSRLLKARFGSVVTTYGGAALDVDNEEDLETIRLRYHDWLAYQEALASAGRARAQDPPDPLKVSGLDD